MVDFFIDFFVQANALCFKENFYTINFMEKATQSHLVCYCMLAKYYTVIREDLVPHLLSFTLYALLHDKTAKEAFEIYRLEKLSFELLQHYTACKEKIFDFLSDFFNLFKDSESKLEVLDNGVVERAFKVISISQKAS